YPPQGNLYGQPQAPGQPQVGYGQYGMQAQYAGVGPRIVAALIDGFILGAVYTVASIIIGILAATLGQSDAAPTIVAIPVLSLWVAAVVVSVAYFPYMEATQGATFGKKVLGLRVVKLDGSPIGWSEAILRFVLRIVDNFFFGLVGLICIAVTEKQQRVGDM